MPKVTQLEKKPMGMLVVKPSIKRAVRVKRRGCPFLGLQNQAGGQGEKRVEGRKEGKLPGEHTPLSLMAGAVAGKVVPWPSGPERQNHGVVSLGTLLPGCRYALYGA